MKKQLVVCGWGVAALLASSVSLLAVEKNGVMLTVTKKTLDRSDTRSGYYSDRIDRTQGLKVSLKNMTFKPQKEGEVVWTILVRRVGYTAPSGFTGSEPLKALQPSEGLDMVMGAAQITGWKDYYDSAKDKMEYQVIVKQGGTEVVRAQSSANFDAIAKTATINKTQPAPPPAADEVAKPATPAAKVPAAPLRSPTALPPTSNQPLNGGALK